MYATIWALLPPVIAIALALVTKEVYSSLFIGILVGGLLYAVPGSESIGSAFESTLLHVFQDGVLGVLSDPYNLGILVFLVILGAMVCLMNKAGGSSAFGRWAASNIKTGAGAQLATIALGVLIFIDDYFNCLTVGSVMRPLTDKHRISRAKLAYLIDATAAPICIIAPVSSWAAAVASYAEEGQGLMLFIRAIPYNFYALFTMVMMVGMVILNVDLGPMARHERAAQDTGDLFFGSDPYTGVIDETSETKGEVIDLVIPIVVLIVSCVIGMLYSGEFFLPGSEGYQNFVIAFSNSDASIGLMLGSVVGLVLTMVFYTLRQVLSFRKLMDCIPEGFKSMTPAILILTFAWTLKTMTDSMGAAEYVERIVKSSAGAFQVFLPSMVFLVGCLLAFATGTSWGTFGILIPITQQVFPADDPLSIICISACMAGAVCGDHCSPISDTTIMASAGAQCDHVNHVSTQLPYAVSVATISFLCYVAAGLLTAVGLPGLMMLPIGVLGILGLLAIIKSKQKN